MGNHKKIRLRFSRKIFLLSCFAPAGNRNRVCRLAGENSTTEPPMLDICLFKSFEKNFCLDFIFSPNFRIKIMNDSSHLGFKIRLFIWVVFLFFDSRILISNKNLRLLFPRKFFLLCIGRESNPGLSRGRRQFYHWTTDAWFKLF